MEKEYPFSVEYAKSNRSTCKKCNSNIGKDSLRLAIMVQSPKFDGKIPRWYHTRCFFSIKKINSFNDIKNFESLRWEDQEYIRENISKIEELDNKIEYAKLNKSMCGKCDEKIDKSTIRLSRKDNSHDKVLIIGPIDKWYHIDCFLSLKGDILNEINNFNIKNFCGFSKLKEVDKDSVINSFKSWSKAGKKRKLDTTEKDESKNKKMSMDDLKKQTTNIWSLQDNLRKNVKKNEIKEILEYNNQFIPIGENKLLSTLTDRMLFGNLPVCSECSGTLRYTNGQYKCSAMVNEWTKCLYVSETVKRYKLEIPEELKSIDILKNYKYIKRNRIIDKSIVTDDNNNNICSRPLIGYKIAIDNMKFEKECNKNTIETKLRDLGGKICKTVDCKTLFFISSDTLMEQCEQGGKVSVHLKRAVQYGVDVVSLDILVKLSQMSIWDAIEKCKLSKFGRSMNEIKTLKEEEKIVAGRSNSNLFQSNQLTQKLKIKGGATVDPDSELEDKAHVYQDTESNEPYSVVLGMTDIYRGTNSFYKLQLLESDHKKKYWLFRAWGRIGTNIGSNLKDSYTDIDEALKDFEIVYFDKTGNHWENRKSFVKIPHRFYPMDIDYGEEATILDENLHSNKTESSLQKSVQDLIQFIFDIASMKATCLEFEIDLDKMPLGKLSNRQIQQAYSILKELQTLLSKDETKSDKVKLLGASTKFYTLMPHNFGMKHPPLIDNLDMLKMKCEMLDSLMEIEVAYKLLNERRGNNKIDDCYYGLNNLIRPIERDCEIWKIIETYVKNTHGATHSHYKGLKIEYIFDLERKNELEKYKEFANLPNKMMLWHGSRRTNWAGILSQGLRIAPPEAPVNGYMFGKGVYFADMVSKSANYCHVDTNNSSAVLLLCEVALGNCVERLHCDSDIQLATDQQHSCKGVGRYCPDPAKNFIEPETGVIYPLGKQIENKKHVGSLIYNEYIVYNTSQIKQRYLLKVKFLY